MWFREFNLLSSLDHECIVKYYDLIETNYRSDDQETSTSTTFSNSQSPSQLSSPPSPTGSLQSFSSNGIQDGNFYLVMEWLGDGCNLTNWILKTRTGRNLDSIRCILKKLFEALEYLAVKEIAHHDIKLDNIIFHEESSSLKLIDFGVSEHCPGDASYCAYGTPAYQSPEILTRSDPGKPVSAHKSDIWSVGIVAYQLANPTGSLPFEGDSILEVFDKIIHRKPDFAVIKDSNLRDLIQKLLEKNPRKRITASEALHHPFITGETGTIWNKFGKSMINSIFNRFINRNKQVE